MSADTRPDPHAREQAPPDTRYECGICWWVYDPAAGDEYAQVRPGTPFAALPEHWHCPVCEGLKSRFMVAGDA